MKSRREGYGSASKATFNKCKWGHCEVDLTNSKRSFYRHIRQDHIDDFEPIHTCEWTSCSKGGFVFPSQMALMSHIQSEHTKAKYLWCSQPGCDLYFKHNTALNHHHHRCHERSLPSKLASSVPSRARSASESSFHGPDPRDPESRLRVIPLLNIISLYPGIGGNDPSSPLTDKSFMEEIEEKFISITPKSPSHAKDNPFAIAQLSDLTGKIRKQRRIGGGSFADVYMGLWVTDAVSTKVAVKQLRSHIYNHGDLPKLEKRLRKEMRIWGNLAHPNIISLLGITSDFGNCTAMVCQWMNQGKLSEYLKEKNNLDLQERLNICIAVAHGLSYLHSQKVIHGDLTPANILMDSDVAHLSDFGLSNVIAELQGPSFLTSMVGGSARWIAPELLLVPDNTTPELTMACDVYSFASVACYVVAGILPYEHLKSDIAIILEILKSGGKSPSKQAQTELLTDEFWEILTMCWATDPATRPDIDDVLHRLQRLKYFRHY